MFVSRFFAFALAALVSVSFVGALPTAEKDALVKRDTPATVLNILNILNNNLVAPTTTINTAVTNNQVSLATIQGPCNDIITFINVAAGGLTGLVPGEWNGQGTMPPSYTDCVTIIVVIIELLTRCLGGILPFIPAIPEILVILSSIEVALCSLLIIVDFLLIEVVIVVGSLVTVVEVILQELLFTCVLRCLGL